MNKNFGTLRLANESILLDFLRENMTEEAFALWGKFDTEEAENVTYATRALANALAAMERCPNRPTRRTNITPRGLQIKPS